MLTLKILLIILFLFKSILTQSCHKNNCEGCYLKRKENEKQAYCICEICIEKKNYYQCHPEDCAYCNDNPKTYLYNSCFCKMCDVFNRTYNYEEKEIKNYSISLIIVPIIFLLIFCICVFCCCIKCKAGNFENEIIIRDRNQNNQINIRPNNSIPNSDNRYLRITINRVNRNNIHSTENIINSKGKEITLDEILNSEIYLGPKKCKKEYEKYNVICTICLEKFKEEIDMVSVTPCFHLFHNKCLNLHFRKNKNAKCPNCNYDIIKHYNKQA